MVVEVELYLGFLLVVNNGIIIAYGYGARPWCQANTGSFVSMVWPISFTTSAHNIVTYNDQQSGWATCNISCRGYGKSGFNLHYYAVSYDANACNFSYITVGY